MTDPNFIIALPGYDATNATPEQSVIHAPETEILKMIDSGSFTQSILGVPGFGYYAQVTKSHRGKGKNLVIAQVDGKDIPFSYNDESGDAVYMTIVDKGVMFTFSGGTESNRTVNVRYRVFSTLLV